MCCLNLCSVFQGFFSECDRAYGSEPSTGLSGPSTHLSEMSVQVLRKTYSITCCLFTSTYHEESVSGGCCKSLKERSVSLSNCENCSKEQQSGSLEEYSTEDLSLEDRVEEILSRYVKEVRAHSKKYKKSRFRQERLEAEENNSQAKFQLTQAVQKFPKSDLHRHACPRDRTNLNYAVEKNMYYHLSQKVFIEKPTGGEDEIAAAEMKNGRYYDDYLKTVTMPKHLKDKDPLQSKQHFFDTFSTIMSTNMPFNEIIQDEISSLEPNSIYGELTVDFKKHKKSDVIAEISNKEKFSIDSNNKMEVFYTKILPWAEEYADYWMQELDNKVDFVFKENGLKQFRKPAEDFLSIGFLVEIMRTVSSDYDEAENSLAVFFADTVAAFKLADKDPQRVWGINVVGPEDNPLAATDYDDQMKILQFLKAKFPHVKITLHAGEIISSGSHVGDMYHRIRDSVEIGGANRIGHGLCIKNSADGAELLDMMRSNGVAVEVCLTSNRKVMGVALKEHPIKVYLNAGVKVVLGTDDPHILNTDMCKEYKRALKIGLTYQQLKACIRNSVDCSFIPGEGIYEENSDIHVIKDRFKSLLDPSVDLTSKVSQRILAGSAKAFKEIILERKLVEAEEAIVAMDEKFLAQVSPDTTKRSPNTSRSYSR